MTRHDLKANGDPLWMARGGEGLPLTPDTSRGETVWLFTCCVCGNRWADPPAPVSGCGCGAGEIVCHRFDFEKYYAIRAHGDPRGVGDE